MIDDLEAGRCVAAVVMSDAWDRQLVANSENCKKRKVGATLITQGNAVPIADKYQMPMSYLIARHLASGNCENYRAPPRFECTFWCPSAHRRVPPEANEREHCLARWLRALCRTV